MNEHIILLEKYNINSDELLFVTMILLIQDGEEYDFINRYFNEFKIKNERRAL